MNDRMGRMEAFDALLEARFEDFFSEPVEPSEHLDDGAKRGVPEPDADGGRNSLPPMPPPAAGRHEPRHRAAPLA